MPSTPLCPSCGAPVSGDDPQGLCSRCLFAALAAPTETGPGQRAPSPPPTVEVIAAAFPQLEILGLIGAGGMGAVFRARQPRLHRLVALKILPQALSDDPTFAERFAREGRLLARLSHPNIVTIHDFGQTGGFSYLLMEYVEGVNLREAMRASRFTAAQALAIVPKICDALQYAHEEGVLHRDIKPENILLDVKGRVKLADFGIAKLTAEPDVAAAPLAPGDETLTHAGAALGTPSYMAPEQRETPADVDHRADIYSLGVVFYELLTGELPAGKFAPPSTRSTVDPRVDAIVAQALEKERERRQYSAGEVRTQVETLHSAPGRHPAAADIVTLILALMSGPLLGGFYVVAPGLSFVRTLVCWFGLAALVAMVSLALPRRKTVMAKFALITAPINLFILGSIYFGGAAGSVAPAKMAIVEPLQERAAVVLPMPSPVQVSLGAGAQTAFSRTPAPPPAPELLPPRRVVADWLRAVRADRHDDAFALVLPGSTASWSPTLQTLWQHQPFTILHQLGDEAVAMSFSDPVVSESGQKQIFVAHLLQRDGRWQIDQTDLYASDSALARIDGFAGHPGVRYDAELREFTGQWMVDVCAGSMTLRDDGSGTLRTSDPGGSVGKATDFQWSTAGGVLSLPWPGASPSGTITRLRRDEFQLRYPDSKGLYAVRTPASEHWFRLHFIEEQASGATERHPIRNEQGGTDWRELGAPVLDESALESVSVARDAAGQPLLSVTFTEAGAKTYRDRALPLVGRPLGIVLEGRLTSVFIVPAQPSGHTLVFGGNFTEREAAELIARIQK